MTDSQIKSVALFFLFIFFNEKKALELTARTLKLIQRKQKGREPSAPNDILMVSIAQKVLEKEKKYFDKIDASIADGFHLPESISVEQLLWLRKQTSLDEFTTLIWSKIVGCDEEHLARGLNTSIGTLRHRIAVSLKTLAGNPANG